MPVVVSGVPELKRALKKFAPDLRKQMDAEIKVALAEVRNAARNKVPGLAPGNLFNWNDKGTEAISRTSKTRAFPKYNSADIRKGITYKMGASRFNSQGFSSLYSLLNSEAAGVIVEWAGRKNPQGRTQKAGRKYGQGSQNIGQSNNPNAGRIFVGAMNGVGPLKQYDKFERGRGRLLYAAYAENQGKALDAVFKAIDKASRLLNERSNANKAGKAA
jgi:hypothetical protein